MLHLMGLFQPMKVLYSHYVQPVQETYGITRTELDILLFLANNPEYDTARDIIEIRRIAKSHVSSSLRSLAKAGYLQGKYHGDNHKMIHLVLLPAALPAVQAGQAAQKAFQDYMYQNIAEEDLAVMNRCLSVMAENLFGKDNKQK